MPKRKTTCCMPKRSTVKAYRQDWTHFVTWCAAYGVNALPASPETVARYLTVRAQTVKVSTLQRRLSAISQAHTAKGLPRFSVLDEPLRSVWAGIRRVHGVAQHRKAPAVTADIQAMVAQLPDSLLGLRDHALLLVGFAAALRRSELVSLTRGDVQFTCDGLTIRLRRSKTDQEAGRRWACGGHPLWLPSRNLSGALAAGVARGLRN
ncbi:MAG: site-specific integrase [Thermaerobacter sp.]|nr:site-specific integrase [Thermaerobacter sp.]